ncbi:hypothetical protein [Streptomyces aureus]|uniref:hypothetical protein n=1 Tax=Streptomyces aureus TaxID=193461 RepID=UPI0033E214E9
MTQRSSAGALKRRFSPHPTQVPRTPWQKFVRAKTDSGWPLLVLNFLRSAVFVVIFIDSALAAHALAPIYWWLSVGWVLDLLLTGHVMVCVARGQAGRLAPEAPGTSPDRGMRQGGRTSLGGYQGKHT